MSSEGTEDKRSGTARFSLRVPALLFAEVLTEQSGTYDKGEGVVDMVRSEKCFSIRFVQKSQFGLREQCPGLSSAISGAARETAALSKSRTTSVRG